MSRILIRLAVLNFCFLLAAFTAGGLSWLHGGLLDREGSVYMWHFSLGLFAIIFNLGLHCLIFIYFLGTGRWVKEVALAYKLPDDPLPKLTRDLKRRTFPPSLLAMLLPIGAAAAGMANQNLGKAWAPPLHFGLAILSLLVNGWACRIAYRNVTVNAGVIAQVTQEAERIRAAHGLPPSAEALKQADSV